MSRRSIKRQGTCVPGRLLGLRKKDVQAGRYYKHLTFKSTHPQHPQFPPLSPPRPLRRKRLQTRRHPPRSPPCASLCLCPPARTTTGRTSADPEMPLQKELMKAVSGPKARCPTIFLHHGIRCWELSDSEQPTLQLGKERGKTRERRKKLQKLLQKAAV